MTDATQTVEERELKLGLNDEAAYATLVGALGVPLRRERQTNVYFDTRRRALLAARALMVRVRVSEQLDVSPPKVTIELTAKDGSRTLEGVTRSRERTASLSAAQWAEVHRARRALTDLELPLAQALRDEAGDALFPVGSLVNERRTYDLGDGYRLEFDRTEFPGERLDYELEVELREPHHTAEEARRRVLELLARHDVEPGPPTTSKFARFLDALSS